MRFFAYLCLLMSLVLSVGAHANSEKSIVLAKMKSYADLVACEHSFGQNSLGKKTTLNDVFLVDRHIDEDFSLNDNTVYYVFWYGDMGCSGGNMSPSYFVTKVFQNGYADKFLVDDDHFAFGGNMMGGWLDENEVGVLNYSYIENIQQRSQDKFVVTAWEYIKIGEYDGVYDKYVYTFNKDYYEGNWYGGWDLVDKKRLERRKNRP